MAQSNFAEKIETSSGSFEFRERVSYPNDGFSEFYILGKTAIIIDFNICKISPGSKLFPYTLITEKQNFYMKNYKSVFRFMVEDSDQIEKILESRKNFSMNLTGRKAGNRSDFADSSPLEFLFEENFIRVYGSDSLKYLYKEYEITGPEGQNYFLDYLVKTTEGEIAVEENGVHYHHPQEIGPERYRKQLLKQNICALWGIKLFRFSTEDCRFKERMEDDIRLFFGNDTSTFLENGITVDRKFKLYKHQEDTLVQIAQKRKEGIKSFLVVFPTASGKSKIIEEDLLVFAKTNKRLSALVLVPNSAIKDDWKKRIENSLQNLKDFIQIETFASAVRHYAEANQKKYNYIVVDEAHHAVAPMLKRVIQYYTPDFLIGLTATDQRPDKKKLEEVFGAYKTPLSLERAMKKRIIAEARIYRIETNIDLSQVRINGKDYVNADLEKSIRITSRNELIAQVLQDYFTKGIAGKIQGIVFCVNVNHAHEMEKVLNSYGLNAKAYTNRTVNVEETLQDFKDKKIRFLCACNMISEGWDYPELGILVMARPTLSKVLYLQQLGRGLRRTHCKQNVFVIDVVDSYGSTVVPVSMHSIFHLEQYVPFGSALKRDYKIGDFITIYGLTERIERIVPVETFSFAEKYADYLSQEQLAREFFVSTDTVSDWVRRGRIKADVTFAFGSRKVHLFSPENVSETRIKFGIKIHDDTTIRKDFFDFLEERDYSLSYKMVFMLGFLRNMNPIGDADIDKVLDYYISFYENRINKGLLVDRKNCPYNFEALKKRTEIKHSMLANPFEKFERKRFFYYSKDLNIISMNHALFSSLSEADLKRIRNQMHEDLKNYYEALNSEYTKEIEYVIHNEDCLKVADSSSS